MSFPKVSVDAVLQFVLLGLLALLLRIHEDGATTWSVGRLSRAGFFFP